MGRFQVDTDELRSAGGQQRGLGDELLGACGTLEAFRTLSTRLADELSTTGGLGR